MKTYLIGSKLLGLANNHDVDKIAIVEKDSGRRVIDGEDVFCKLKSELDARLNFAEEFTQSSCRLYTYNYQYDADIIGQDFPLIYHILDKRDKYVELLNWIVDNRACNFIHTDRFNHGNCSKAIYHVAYLTFIMENNSVKLTAEQKAVVQQIHDLKMPYTYLRTLEEKIRRLKQ